MNTSICSVCGHDESKCSDEETYRRAKELIKQTEKASAGLLQRDLKISYAKSAEILDKLETEGLIGPEDGVNPRKVYTNVV
jgi:S-DNA-T family DNA segregation ATPase FtsK/SpoIIIE